MEKLFKIGDVVRRKPETVEYPDDYPEFIVMFIEKKENASGGFMYSEDGANWTSQSVLEKVFNNYQEVENG